MSKRGLHSLAKAGRCADITTLLACKADPNVRNADGLAALHLATSHVDVIKTLLDFGARPGESRLSCPSAFQQLLNTELHVGCRITYRV